MKIVTIKRSQRLKLKLPEACPTETVDTMMDWLGKFNQKDLPWNGNWRDYAIRQNNTPWRIIRVQQFSPVEVVKQKVISKLKEFVTIK